MAEGDEQANINNYTQLEGLLKKRIGTWEYLQQVHAGATHWMNVAPIGAHELADHFADTTRTQRRCEEWLCLGASLASLLPIGVGFPFVAAVHQLWDEFEAHFGYLTQAEKRHRVIKLEYLILPNIPSALDYQLVFTTLLEVLIATYARFLDPSMATQMSNDVHAVFLKLDGRFRHYIYDPSMKQLNQVALSAVTRQMSGLGFERAALEAVVSSVSDASLSPPTSAPLERTASTSAPVSLASASSSTPFSSSSFPSLGPKTKFSGTPAGRHRKEGDTHHFEDLYIVEEAGDTEGCSLTMNLEGVRLKGYGQEQLFPFQRIPRYRYEDKTTGYFEFEFDKPSGGLGVHRFRTNQAQKISDTMGMLVEKLIKMRNAKK